MLQNWKTNLSVCDVTFVPKLSDPDRVIAYLSSQNEGNLLQGVTGESIGWTMFRSRVSRECRLLQGVA